MPLLLWPLLGLGAGFGLGFFTGSNTKQVIMWALIALVVMYAYSKFKG